MTPKIKSKHVKNVSTTLFRLLQLVSFTFGQRFVMKLLTLKFQTISLLLNKTKIVIPVTV